MFSFLYSPLPDTDAYLTRIGASKDVSLTKEYLDHLIYQHQINVPFENIDICHFKKQSDLGAPNPV